MNFLKTQSLGNDFIILDEENISSQKNLCGLAKKLCDRHTGVGADGILIALPSDKTDIKMRIINADGSEAEMCGNGIRCFAKYAFEKELIKKNKFAVETLAGIIEVELKIDNNKISAIKVDMGNPSFLSDDIPILSKDHNQIINILGENYHTTSLLLGVPHTIVFVNSIDEKKMKKIGALIENNELFPKKTNVDFVEILDPSKIRVKTWERGVGMSKACGTGACASVVTSNINGKTGKKVTVHFEIGELFIEWCDNTIYMTGADAKNIYEGKTLS